MAAFSDEIKEPHKTFIEKQKMFFVATAAEDGRINLSPKGLDTLKILDKNTIAWLNLTGSGNETAAHLLLKNRITLMFCSFDENPLILRIYGKAKTIHPRDKVWAKYVDSFSNEFFSQRNIFIVDVETVQTSCGFAVPFYEFKGHRPKLEEGWQKKGKEGIEAYWVKQNTISIDGHPTHILE